MRKRQLPLREITTLAFGGLLAVGCTSTKDCYVSSECDMYGQPMCNTAPVIRVRHPEDATAGGRGVAITIHPVAIQFLM